MRRVLDAIVVAEAEIARQIGAYGIGVEHDCVEKRRQHSRQRRLAGARQPHDEDFSRHVKLHASTAGTL